MSNTVNLSHDDAGFITPSNQTRRPVYLKEHGPLIYPMSKPRLPVHAVVGRDKPNPDRWDFGMHCGGSGSCIRTGAPPRSGWTHTNSESPDSIHSLAP
ncbi:hypothetical protein M0657_008167 [Pyricularia oryzae]|nr:hypothetical protein M9X92_008179 [Pyricularia oryzae]KAI7917266.1 hypothetical protein M0657_008167 [Pyricularia oryzae]